jgi:hypothetical protein
MNFVLDHLYRIFYVNIKRKEILLRPGDIKIGGDDVVVPISYTTRVEELTNCTKENLKVAVSFSRLYLIKLAFSSCSYVFPGSEIVENTYKKQFCLDNGINPIIARPMVNTVDEAFQIKDELDRRGIKPKNIILVTGELHSWSAHYVWKRVFPESRIFVKCNSCYKEVQEDHPVLASRTLARWTISNLLREAALMFLPLKYVRTVKHKAAKLPMFTREQVVGLARMGAWSVDLHAEEGRQMLDWFSPVGGLRNELSFYHTLHAEETRVNMSVDEVCELLGVDNNLIERVYNSYREHELSGVYPYDKLQSLPDKKGFIMIARRQIIANLLGFPKLGWLRERNGKIIESGIYIAQEMKLSKNELDELIAQCVGIGDVKTTIKPTSG